MVNFFLNWICHGVPIAIGMPNHKVKIGNQQELSYDQDHITFFSKVPYKIRRNPHWAVGVSH
jgi:hypothetical protein